MILALWFLITCVELGFLGWHMIYGGCFGKRSVLFFGMLSFLKCFNIFACMGPISENSFPSPLHGAAVESFCVCYYNPESCISFCSYCTFTVCMAMAGGTCITAELCNALTSNPAYLHRVLIACRLS